MEYKYYYKIQLKYKDGQIEVLYVYENFRKNITLFVSDVRDNYKINNKQANELLDLLLN